MITVTNLSLQFGGSKLFNDVNLKFVPGNCYGVIGANGAGKSTFLKILSGEIDYTSGELSIPNNVRMSVLKQDHFMYDEFSVMETVMMGNKRLYDVMKEKDALYAKEDFTDEDGVKASELEGEFAEMNGWEAETEIAQILQGLGVGSDLHYSYMRDLNGGDKVKVMLAQALFGRPGIILLDEPTNNLDIESINWLEDFLLEFEGLVIVVSHDRHFLNTVCTHIVDIDYKKISMYVGNYDFWYESSQLMQQLMRDQNRKREDKIKDLQNFIQRFSANKSKSKQATSRRKLLEKLEIEEMPASSRRYPFVKFSPDREVGNEILTVEGLSKTIDGTDVLKNISFRVNRDDKIAFVGENELAQSTLFKILVGEMEPDTGTIKWGQTITKSYFPKDNSEFFDGVNLNLVDWMRQYSEDQSESFLRGFLGRMLFSGDDALKPANVLSGGERVRCMLSRMMLSGSNVLVLDQPTNHLDLESITALNNGLMDFKEIVLFSSHDHQFIQTVANRIIELNEQGMVDMAMTYDEYLERKENRQRVS
ncbi:putative ABC transporter ATP-binding protein YbiT [bioreactor metagenome]|jgi:ATPase subunit of ABC transporter with duplicated ATPase domains|uniref:ATPase subunit of ABC transporter with duplicated ATPase domains n=2 Tax=root TaxID=1 RepID=A0A562J152_9FIRM|nr:ABC-F family ATP-binding cassette domain-containing protein [Sedimentibacter saalensis]MEA5096111.1 ABC-F family ATP-binding cassette domain-containing protein [Sedimentibacter saalensis]TWH76928.1 ATPase subunit of ABC transporter with duplicated ATPase domains [Sedimentibacter saalensis]